MALGLGAGLLLLSEFAWGAPLDMAHQLRSSGQYQQAEAAYKKLGTRGMARLGLARVQLETGRLAEAVKTARAVAKGKLKARALTLAGEAQREMGKLAAAERTLKQALAVAPRHYRALIFLGLVYHEQGKQAEAKSTFEIFYDDYDEEKLKKDSAEHLTYVGMACRYTDNFRDASDTFRDAVAASGSPLEAYLQWAEISLEKYEAGYAEQYFDRALKINPRLPAALVGMARVKLEQSNAVDEALELLDRADQTNPRYVDAKVVRAKILLDAEENDPAEALLKRALGDNPDHLGAHTALATSAFLRGDTARFAKIQAQVFQRNPRYSAFYHDVVTQAVRHHLYAESIELSKQAIKLNPQDWYSLADLGTNYLRVGEDQAGLTHLKQAFAGDPFNVRVHNLLNLFDELAKDYTFIRSAHFKLRVHKEEARLIKRVIVPLLEKAYGVYTKKYSFKPRLPIIIELFKDPGQYAVRTVGLPGLAALGVCFGGLITSISPTNGKFNWGQVLWHELNHVFTIQMSRSRVPRWLTEGLADREPTLERVEWKRENDFDIFKALRAGRLKGLGSMNTAFTRAKSLQEMVVAYYQGSLLVNFLIKGWGLPRLLSTLKQYGQGHRTETILPALTGLSLAELDRRFRAAEEHRLAHYRGNWNLDRSAYQDLDARQKAATARPEDPAAQADLAVALLAAGKSKEAGVQALKVLATDKQNKKAIFVAARSALARRDRPGAEQLLRRLIAAGGDGYEARLELGRAALARKDLKQAELHLKAAKRLDPERSQPYALLAEAYEKAKKNDQVIAELKGLAELEQQQLPLVAKLVDLLVKRKDHAGVRRYGMMAYYIQPASAKLNEALAEAFAAPAPSPSLARAVWFYETALLCQPKRPAQIHLRLARLHLQRKDRRRARAQVRSALALEPGNAEAKALGATIK